MKKEYLPRILDQVLEETLASIGAVLIEGPKWCGKTRTAKELSKSAIYMQDPDNAELYMISADTKPSLLLVGDTPRLIDEWQIAPVLWDAVRHAVDQRNETGQFILTGSATPVDNLMRHSGTGRIARIKMRPMSLYESKESSGAVSIGMLFDNQPDIEAVSDMTIERLASILARGGWPASVVEKENKAFTMVYNYVESVINADISKVDGVEKNPANVRALLRSLARNTASPIPMSTLRKDMASDEDDISEKTISSYLNALRRICIVEDLPAWNPAMRSKAAIRTSPKRHFVDPSIAAAVLRATPNSLLQDLNTYGLLFESLCVRDLRVYSQAIDGEAFHYRDKNGLEADIVIHLKDGRWAAVEVKLGTKAVDTAASTLLQLSERVNSDKMNPPAFLMVITATGFAYRRKDGVYVVPIGCLKH